MEKYKVYTSYAEGDEPTARGSEYEIEARNPLDAVVRVILSDDITSEMEHDHGRRALSLCTDDETYSAAAYDLGGAYDVHIYLDQHDISFKLPVISHGLTVAQAASELGVNRQRVHQLIRAGKLTASRVGSVWIVDADSVRRRISDTE